jgi:hypothetical protein
MHFKITKRRLAEIIKEELAASNEGKVDMRHFSKLDDKTKIRETDDGFDNDWYEERHIADQDAARGTGTENLLEDMYSKVQELGLYARGIDDEKLKGEIEDCIFEMLNLLQQDPLQEGPPGNPVDYR